MVDSKTPEVQPAQTIENEADDSKLRKQYSQTSNQAQEEQSTPKTYTQNETNHTKVSVRKKTQSE